MAGGFAGLNFIYEMGKDLYDAAADYQKYQNDLRNNQRDFDYQKAVQQQIFEREDTAVQRRMADLQAAGLNPNLAAGSAAGAGAVVGRSNTPQVNVPHAPSSRIGEMLDMLQHEEQLKQQKEQSAILNNEKQISRYERLMAERANYLDRYQSMIDGASLLYALTGRDSDLSLHTDGDHFYFEIDDLPDNFKVGLKESPLMQNLRLQMQNNKNSADMLQKDAEWYTADKIANYAGTAANIFSGVGSGLFNYNRAAGARGYRLRGGSYHY